jgi:HK97 family phage major capsid protein
MKLKNLEDRAAKLQAALKELVGDGNTVGTENRSKFYKTEAALHEVETMIATAKDDELTELRSRLETGEEDKADKSGTIAFRSYLRSGEEKVENRSALVVATDANGGFLAPENMHAEMVDKVRAINPILSMATTFNLTGGSASIELPFKATHGGVANAAETGTRAEQAEPTVGNNTLTCYDYYTDQRASQQYLDTVADAESMLLQWIYEDVYEQAEKDAADGNGTNKCSGLFGGGYGVQNVATAGKVAATDLLNQYFSLNAKYRTAGSWLANSTTMAQLVAMQHPASTNTPLLTQGPDGTWSLFGRPVEQTDNAPVIGTGTKPVAFGDIAKAYAVGLHKQMSVLRDPYTATPLVRFYGFERIGGRPWDMQACVLLSTAVGA